MEDSIVAAILESFFRFCVVLTFCGWKLVDVTANQIEENNFILSWSTVTSHSTAKVIWRQDLGS